MMISRPAPTTTCSSISCCNSTGMSTSPITPETQRRNSASRSSRSISSRRNSSDALTASSNRNLQRRVPKRRKGHMSKKRDNEDLDRIDATYDALFNKLDEVPIEEVRRALADAGVD